MFLYAYVSRGHAEHGPPNCPTKPALHTQAVAFIEPAGEIEFASANDAFDPALWETFVSTTLGLEVPILAALPRLHNSPLAMCGCKKFCMDFHGDHTSTCTAHSGATKAHEWMVSVLGPLFRTAGHVVRTQHEVTASAGQRRGDVEIRNYLRDQAGSRSLVFDLSIAHDRFGQHDKAAT